MKGMTQNMMLKNVLLHLLLKNLLQSLDCCGSSSFLYDTKCRDGKGGEWRMVQLYLKSQSLGYAAHLPFHDL